MPRTLVSIGSPHVDHSACSPTFYSRPTEKKSLLRTGVHERSALLPGPEAICAAPQVGDSEGSRFHTEEMLRFAQHDTKTGPVSLSTLLRETTAQSYYSGARHFWQIT